MSLLVELSGENVGLGRAECLALTLSDGIEKPKPTFDGRVLIIETQTPAEELAQRLALAWSVSEHLLSCSISQLDTRLAKVEVPTGKFRVKVERLNPDIPPELGMAIPSKIGKIFSEDHEVDLENPDFELKVLLAGRAHVGILKQSIDRGSFESRRSENRLFNHPISLHPRLARALVNLSGVRRGQFLLDPFCGTGGILIEAGLIGAVPIGGDIDSRMIEGTRENLSQFGVEGAELQQVDVGEWPSLIGQVDAIATDPPYGRAASTNREPIRYLYRRTYKAIHQLLKDGGKVAIVLPDKEHVKLATGRFELMGSHPTRVHRSLTRHFCVFRK